MVTKLLIAASKLNVSFSFFCSIIKIQNKQDLQQLAVS